MSERENEKVQRKERKKGCNIRFILEGHIQLLVHRDAVSVAVVTIGDNLFLFILFLYPLNCIYLHFYLHLLLTTGVG